MTGNFTRQKLSSSITNLNNACQKQLFLQLLHQLVLSPNKNQVYTYAGFVAKIILELNSIYASFRSLPLVELLSHWQQCIASLSTISLEQINACYIQSLFQTPQR